MADTSNVKILADREDIVAVADAVRAKTGAAEALTLGDMVTAIESITGGDTSAEDGILSGEITGSYINDRVTSVRNQAFWGCNSLVSVELPNVVSIGQHAFNYCNSLVSVELPNVVSIDYGAFHSCVSLVSVELPYVTSIGVDGFNNCVSLTSIDLPNVTSIGTFAFSDCSSLTSIDLPNVTLIGPNAFSGCSSLTSVTLGAAQVCQISSPSFPSTCVFFVPASLVSEYKNNSGWNRYRDRIYAIGTTPTLSFEIDGTPYSMTENMTWGEWVASEYNVDNYFIIDNMYICRAGTTDTVVADNSGYVTNTDIITPGFEYWVDPY